MASTARHEEPKFPTSTPAGATDHDVNYSEDHHEPPETTNHSSKDPKGQMSKDAENGKETDVEQTAGTDQHEDRPFSIFTHTQKRLILVCAGLCAFFSPISGQIYLPALNKISHDLNVSDNKINLTITTYLIMQGLAPAFIGGLSDEIGRRPAYLACFVIYAAANLGLGLQSNYAALMVLRCVQSAGSSGTVALGNAVAADLITSQERGVYVSYLSVAPQAGPSIGPIIGGLLAQYLGWHSIFWFLLICAAVVFVPVLLFLPETCRKVVDDGSVPPQPWNRCQMNSILEKKQTSEQLAAARERSRDFAKQRKFVIPNPIGSVKIVFTKEAGFALAYIALLCCAYYATIALIPSQFGRIYSFNEIQIALCYLPLGAGSLLASFVRGRFIDARYRFYAKKLNMPLQHNRNLDLDDFPIERARLEVAVPTLALASVFIIGFGWMVQYKVHLAGPLIFLFVIGFSVSASINTVQVLMIDIFPGRAGAATAANNLCRCWVGAGATSGVVPMINKIGMGWTATFFGGIIILFSPILWYIMRNGPEWRRQARQKKLRGKA